MMKTKKTRAVFAFFAVMAIATCMTTSAVAQLYNYQFNAWAGTPTGPIVIVPPVPTWGCGSPYYGSFYNSYYDPFYNSFQPYYW